jgi:hypothetical protein
MADTERLEKIEQTLVEIRERLAKVETKLDNGKKNGSLDLKTWAIIIGLLFGGGAANYGLQTAVNGEPQVKVIQAPPIDYSMMRPDGR